MKKTRLSWGGRGGEEEGGARHFGPFFTYDTLYVPEACLAKAEVDDEHRALSDREERGQNRRRAIPGVGLIVCLSVSWRFKSSQPQRVIMSGLTGTFIKRYIYS